ncbi:MAG: hypothetical protein ACRDT6_26285 [Micromonosporaceae bacterium]
MERPDSRTLLERIIQESDRTLEETCEDFEARARELKERATLSIRQLSRWLAGEVDNARPSSRRVARHLWGHSFQRLLGPPDIRSAITLDASQAVPVLAEPHIEVRQQTGTPLASWEEEIAMTAEESARFVRRTGTAVTPELMEQLNSDVRWLAVEYLRKPPYSVFRSLASLRRDVFDLIDHHPRPEHLPDLYRVAGQLSALLAHASSDLGQSYAADSHTRTAWLCADLAGDRSLRAYIRWVQSNVAYWHGRYRDAAELAESGQQYAAGNSDLLRLASQQARAASALADDRETDRALAVASDARGCASDEPPPPGVFYFPPGKAAYYASEVRLALGGEANHRRAATEAEEAVTLLEGEGSAELTAAAQLDLVAAHVALGDLDAANDHAQAVLQLPAESRTVPIVGRVARIDDALADQAFAKAALASDLREQIAVFRAYPAARELPALPP